MITYCTYTALYNYVTFILYNTYAHYIASAGSTVGDATFRFANYYGDHMVLQQAPASATVWGYVLLCGAVTVTADGKSYMATIIPGAVICYNIQPFMHVFIRHNALYPGKYFCFIRRNCSQYESYNAN